MDLRSLLSCQESKVPHADKQENETVERGLEAGAREGSIRMADGSGARWAGSWKELHRWLSFVVPLG